MIVQNRKFSLISLVFLLVLAFSGLAQAQPFITIEPTTVNIPPNGVVTVNVVIEGFVAGVGGLTGPACEVQLGTTLATPGITYTTAPGLRVLSVAGAGGFTLLASFFDNSGGNLVLDVVHPGTGISDGVVAAITFRADEQQGATLPVATTVNLVPNVANITIRDCQGNAFVPSAANAVDGTINVTPYGDINFNGIVDGGDATRCLRFTVGLGTLNTEEKQVADVAPDRGVPPAAIVDINDCNAIALAALGMISLPQASLAPITPTSASLATKAALIGENKLVAISLKRALKGAAGVQGTLRFDPAKTQINSVSGANGFIILAQNIDNEAGIVKFVAASTQAKGLRSGEIVHINAAGDTRSLKLSLDTFDTEGRSIKSAFAVKTTKAKAVSLSNLVLSKNAEGMHFIAQGRGIESVKLEVFSLAGKRVFDSGFIAGNALAWHILANNGKAVANGVYLYVISVRGTNGEIVKSDVRKLVVLL